MSEQEAMESASIASISGQHFGTQFKEEWDAAAADAGRFSFQSLIHQFVRWGIVGSYTAMARMRRLRQGDAAT